MVKGKLNIRASLAAVGIGFWLTMAGGVSAGPGGDERIIGGNVANPADWPYAAAITTRSGQQFCGGSVISADAVLTAAHCVSAFGKPVNPNSVRVVTGRPDLSDEGTGQELKPDEIFVHRRFLRRARHDIAVIRLADPTTATPAVLPTPSEADQATEPGDELRVAGWGSKKRAGGPGSDVLRDVSTFAVRDRKCERWPFLRFRSDEDICTLGERIGDHRTSSCYGDSGGPLVADTLGGARLVGAVSRGGLRCGVRLPTVYSSVADNLAFITEKADLP